MLPLYQLLFFSYLSFRLTPAEGYAKEFECFHVELILCQLELANLLDIKGIIRAVDGGEEGWRG